MPKRKDVDGAKLIKAVQSGRASTEIMAEFGIKTSSTLKAKYLDALVAQGDVPGVVTSRGPGAGKKGADKTVQVGKRGSIVIPKGLVEEMGFEEGMVFSVRRTKAGVSLKRG